jgi:hypothetical protein
MGSRSELAVLQKLVAAPEPGTNNIGTYLSSRAAMLAPALGVPVTSLEAAAHVPDEEIAPQLQALLRQRLDRNKNTRQLGTIERAAMAAVRLSRTARWERNIVVLDPDLLLGDLVVDTSKKYVAFSFSEHDLTLERAKLADVARVITQKTYPDRSAFLDARGLHLRWKGGRGGLDLVTQVPHVFDRDRILTVVIDRPVCLPLAPVRRGGARLGDILGDLGLLP